MTKLLFFISWLFPLIMLGMQPEQPRLPLSPQKKPRESALKSMILECCDAAGCCDDAAPAHCPTSGIMIASTALGAGVAHYNRSDMCDSLFPSAEEQTSCHTAMLAWGAAYACAGVTIVAALVDFIQYYRTTEAQEKQDKKTA